jgi:hypothetical protein
VLSKDLAETTELAAACVLQAKLKRPVVLHCTRNYLEISDLDTDRCCRRISLLEAKELAAARVLQTKLKCPVLVN